MSTGGKPRVTLCLRDPWSVYTLHITEHYSLILRTGICWPQPQPYDRFGSSKLRARQQRRAKESDYINYCCTLFKHLRTLHNHVTETGINKPGSHSQLVSCQSVWLWHSPPPNQVMMGKNMLFTCMIPQSVLFLEKKNNNKIWDTGFIPKEKDSFDCNLKFCRLQEDLYSLRLLVTFEDEKTVFRSFWNKVCQEIGLRYLRSLTL